MGFLSLFSLIKFGGMALICLTVFLYIKGLGKKEQILADKEEQDAKQNKIDSVKPDTPDDAIDSLHDGKF